MQLLYEENGEYKVGTVLADNNTSLQVEALHGRHVKVKASSVLLRFAAPSAAELLRESQALAEGVDTTFLWECAGEDEFAFDELAREYVGHAPTAVESAGILFKLQSAPVYFHRRGKGRFRPAPPDVLKAALAALEKKRLQQLQVEAWAAELASGRFPEPLRPMLTQLLYQPDRNRPETRALETACEESGLSAPQLLLRCGALASPHDYHLGRFLFECFPRGTGFPAGVPVEVPAGLPRADVRAFSLDDATTTEIDDAFSITPLDEGRFRVGIHIAAPALGFAPGSPVDTIARARLSTVYFPGEKITMLPPEAITAFSLDEGTERPALSLYLDVRESDMAVENEHSAIEMVPIAANLRHQAIGELDQAFPEARVPEGIPFAPELYRLWRLSIALEASRGKAPGGQERPDYHFHVEGERITITERSRGTPLDKLVAELMIRANYAWGRMLDQNGVAAIYRTQAGGKVRMTTSAAPHQGLGISHYAWSSSPLRRYVDLVNQWQLVALLNAQEPPFAANAESLLSAVHAFDSAYGSYGDFQDRMERYWCLRWLQQESVTLVTGEVLRDNLVRVDHLPMVMRVPSLTDAGPGARVSLEVGDIDLLANEVSLRYLGPLAAAGSAADA